MKAALDDLVGILTVIFLSVSIAVIVRGWSVIMWFVDRTRLVRELEGERERRKDIEEDREEIRQSLQTARMTSDTLMAEITALNVKMDRLQETVEGVELKLGDAMGYIVELVDYIDVHPGGSARPEPPESIRADIERARALRK